MAAIILGFCAALTLWAFEFGRGLAGLDRGSKEELDRLRAEVVALRSDRDKAQSIADTADSLLKTEKATHEQLAQALKRSEATSQELRAELAFYERLLPAPGDGVAIRGFQAEMGKAGRIEYLMLVIQSGRTRTEFKGRYEISAAGTLDGKPWSQTAIGGARPLSVTQSARFEGMVELPSNVVVKTVQARILDARGTVKSTQTARF